MMLLGLDIDEGFLPTLISALFILEILEVQVFSLVLKNPK